MSEYVTDTQALVKFMTDEKVISQTYQNIFEDTDKGINSIIIPAIVIMEILYLFEKSRIPVGIFDVEKLLESKNYIVEPLSLDILKVASEIDDIPELHDRLIAATSKYLDIPIITNDAAIHNSKHTKTA